MKFLERFYDNELDDQEAKIVFFYPFLKITSRIINHLNCKFEDNTSEFLNNFCQGQFDLEDPPRNPTLVATKAKPLIIQPNPHPSRHVSMEAMPNHPTTTQTLVLSIVLALIRSVMNHPHPFATYVDFAKILTQSNGWIVRCTILPLAS